MLEELLKLSKESGSSLILVTHNQDVAAAMERSVRVVDGWSLGWRLTFRPSGPARARTMLGILGFTFATLILTVVLALIQAARARNDRTVGQEPVITAAGASFHVSSLTLPYRSRPWTITFVAADTGGAAPPPGLPRFPALGQPGLSPALQALSRTDPAVAERVPGHRAGVIAPSGLVSPISCSPSSGAPWPPKRYGRIGRVGAGQG